VIRFEIAFLHRRCLCTGATLLHLRQGPNMARVDGDAETVERLIERIATWCELPPACETTHRRPGLVGRRELEHELGMRRSCAWGKSHARIVDVEYVRKAGKGSYRVCSFCSNCWRVMFLIEVDRNQGFASARGSLWRS